MPVPSTNRVSAQDFYDYDKCPHRVYLNRFGKADEKLPQSAFLNLLFENALLHEKDVLRDLKYEMPSGTTLEERALATQLLMQNGVERIYQAVFLQPDRSGIPDLVKKVSGESKFGNYFYMPLDIKSGSGFEDEERGVLRVDYGMQLYHYGLLLETMQGVLPEAGEILNRRKQRIVYHLNQFRASYEATYPHVQGLATGVETDEPAYSAVCGQCQWWGHSKRFWWPRTM